MNTKGVFGLAGMVLIATSISGCVGQMLLDAAAQASLDSETPESTGEAAANYRGQTCLQLAIERKRAADLINHEGGDSGDREYLAKHGRWMLSSVEQVEREQGCLAGTTVNQAGDIEYVTKHPESASQFNLPPGALAPAVSSSVPSASPQPRANAGSVSNETGLPQTSIAELIARETPEKYRTRSCDYLREAVRSGERYEATSDAQTKAFGSRQKTVASQALASRNCPPSSSFGGRIGAGISSMDPIKAARLNLPLEGTSIESLVVGGNADRAGVKKWDVVVAVDNTIITDSVEFVVALGHVPIGSSATLKVWRGQGFIQIPVVVGPGPVVPAAAVAEKAAFVEPSNSSLSMLDMKLGAVTPSYAKAVGLPEAAGAWVIETAKGGKADRAGIKALDVIIEVSGQDVASPNDLLEIGGRMRSGYKATVSVWRNQAKRDVQMVLKNE